MHTRKTVIQFELPAWVHIILLSPGWLWSCIRTIGFHCYSWQSAGYVRVRGL